MRFFWSSLFYILFHSFIAHKEHRFLLPIIPLLIPYLCYELNNYSNWFNKMFTYITIILNINLAIYFGNYFIITIVKLKTIYMFINFLLMFKKTKLQYSIISSF